MSNVLMQPKQPTQQDAPMHCTPPAGANLTNARGMVAPRRYDQGTASVPGSSADASYLDPSANARGQLRLNSDGTVGQGYQPAVLSGQNWAGRNAPPASASTGGSWLTIGGPPHDYSVQPQPGMSRLQLPAFMQSGAPAPNYVRPGPPAAPITLSGQDAPTIQPLPAGRGFGASAGQDFNSRNTFAPAPGPQVFAAPDPLAHMAGRGLPSVPLSVPHAQGMLDAALGAPAADSSQTAPSHWQPGQTIHVYAHHPQEGGGMSDTLYTASPGGQWIASQGAGGVGSAGHAVANPGAYSPEQFHAATRGHSLNELTAMAGLAQSQAQTQASSFRPRLAQAWMDNEDAMNQPGLTPAQLKALASRSAVYKHLLGVFSPTFDPNMMGGGQVDEYGRPTN